MRDIYERAQAVLVIDLGLVHVSTQASPEEILMRISCCGWARRLWTFHEKILANELYFVLEDGILDINDTHDQVMNYVTNPATGAMSARSYSSAVALDASTFLRNRRMKRAKPAEHSRDELTINFGSVWESLQWRATSWPTDEPICLATAFGLDLRFILELPEDQQMKAIFAVLTGYPPYMIFAPLPRMQEPGWKWTPRSLMRPRGMSAAKMHHMNSTTFWHPEGLVVQFPGFVIDISYSLENDSAHNNRSVDLGPTLAFKDKNSSNWYCSFREFEEWISDEARNDSFILGNLFRPASILSCPVEALWLSEKNSPQLWPGILVDVKRQTEDIIFTEFITRVNVGAMPPQQVQYFEE